MFKNPIITGLQAKQIAAVELLQKDDILASLPYDRDKYF
jgi:hypothetical protein